MNKYVFAWKVERWPVQKLNLTLKPSFSLPFVYIPDKKRHWMDFEWEGNPQRVWETLDLKPSKSLRLWVELDKLLAPADFFKPNLTAAQLNTIYCARLNHCSRASLEMSWPGFCVSVLITGHTGVIDPQRRKPNKNGLWICIRPPSLCLSSCPNDRPEQLSIGRISLSMSIHCLS